MCVRFYFEKLIFSYKATSHKFPKGYIDFNPTLYWNWLLNIELHQFLKEYKKGLRQCAKLQDFVWVIIVIVVIIIVTGGK